MTRHAALALVLLAADARAVPILVHVENGGFEDAGKDSTVPAGWETDTKDRWELVSDARHGAKSLHVTNQNSYDWSSLSTKIEGLPEGEIAVGCWVKLEDVDKSENAWELLHVYFTFTTLDGKETKVDALKLDGTQPWRWMTKKKIAVPASLKAAKLTIGFDGVSGQAWFDRLTVVKGSELPPETISASDDVALQADAVKGRISAARTAIRKAAPEASAKEALADARGRVNAVAITAATLETEAAAAAKRAGTDALEAQKAADMARAAAEVRTKLAEAARLIQEGEDAQAHEAPAKAEEISAARAAAAIEALREASRAAERTTSAAHDALVVAGTWGGGIFRTVSATTWEAANAEAPHPYAAFLTVGEAGRLYCGGSDDRLYESDDNGKTWSATPTLLPATASGFLIDPADPVRWVITTWGQGVFRSVDEGRNWKAAPAPSKFTRAPYALADGTATRYYVIADESAIFRADGPEAPWTELARLPRGIKARALGRRPGAAAVLIAATDAGLAEIAADGTISWPKLEVSTAFARSLAGDAGRVLVGTWGHGVVEWRPGAKDAPRARVINTGLADRNVFALAVSFSPRVVVEEAEAESGPRIWTARTAGLASSKINGLTADPNNEKVMYASTGSGVFKTTDGGVTWKAASTGLSGVNLGHLVVDPKDSNVVYVAPAYLDIPAGVQKSSDGGKTWAEANSGLPTRKVLWLDVDRNNPAILYCMTWGDGVFRSDDAAATWYKLQEGLNESYGYCIVAGAADPATVFAGMANTGLWRFDPSAWKWVASANGLNSNDIWHAAQSPADGNIWLVGTPGGGLYKTANLGKAWKRISAGLDITEIYRVAWHPKKPGVAYLGGKAVSGTGGGGVYRSVDGGESWLPDNAGLPVLGIEDLIVTQKGLIYVATQNGIFVKQD